jgi:radical SAM superfamily enzyme YgiQ (UPF0313 family)
MEKFLYSRYTVKKSNYTVWMGFPEKYEFSLSSIGYLWLCKIIDETDDINLERICSDSENIINYKPDLFGFSISFDFDFLNVFSMLEKYNIPLKSAERNNPLVFAGGPVVTANPEPYKDIFDFFIIGDGEELNKQVIEFCKNNRELTKSELLFELSKIEGVYVPYISKNVVKSTKRLENCIYTPILSDEAFFKNTFIIEVERGCANRCGFCLASYLNLPLRLVPNDKLFDVIDLGLKNTNKLAFLGAEVSAHPKFKEVCKYIYDKINSGEKIEMHFSSLRVDAIDKDVVKTLVKAGQKNITLAIEAGSERLRKVINKNVSEEQILNAVKIASENGLKGIKFYGMLGLPTETQEDIEALITLAKNIKMRNKEIDITFGFSSFVPKPHTPFQWYGRDNTKSFGKKCNYIQKEFHKLGINVQLPSVKWDYWQAVLSRGDDSFSDFLIETYKSGGKLGAFKSSAKKYKINTDYYAYENISFDKKLPWDFIEIKPGKQFLINEHKRLIK